MQTCISQNLLSWCTMTITEFTEFSQFTFITELFCEHSSSKLTVEHNFMKEHLHNQ